MSESSPFYCELCEQENGNAYNLATHLGSKAHRAKVEAVVAEYTERLNVSKSALSAVEQRIAALTAQVEENEESLTVRREEAEANDVVIKEQCRQIQKNAVDITALKSECDSLTEKVEPLRFETGALERKNSELQAENSKLVSQRDALVADIQKSVAMRPELEELARDEIYAELVKEEEARFNADRLERLKNQRDYQTGEISLDEYTRREQTRISKK